MPTIAHGSNHPQGPTETGDGFARRDVVAREACADAEQAAHAAGGQAARRRTGRCAGATPGTTSAAAPRSRQATYGARWRSYACADAPGAGSRQGAAASESGRSAPVEAHERAGVVLAS